MSVRELVVLGTGSQVPTRERNHNGYFLRWDGEGILFDPGEGTQRQMSLAGVSASDITRICLTHFHGDHCLGLPGVIQRLSLDAVGHPVHAHYPASGADWFGRLRHATPFHETAELVEVPVTADGEVARTAGFTLTARRLDHRTETFGYRLVEPDGRSLLPELLAEAGIAGPDVGRLQREGRLVVGGRTVELAQVSRARRGLRFAFVMDTRLCPAVGELADGADLLVMESTYLEADAHFATTYGHLTARQAAQVAADCGVGTLVLTHFSRRYHDPARFEAEAREVFDGDLVIARDLIRVPLRRR
ncbi:MAG TPA: ribonuclease Z [Kineosporiaceae bacterium]|nr:ribonuclease Z [Kineosporiaceae bacterium]